ncbi:MAG: hypothetical protein Q8Q07_05465 [Dehalococcoidales bacterium]|nr:hypothetical protein [Dehalococcoidales bacterium]
MSEKRMLIIDVDVARRIEENRGDMSSSEFIDFLVNKCLNEDAIKQDYITKEEFNEFQQGTRELLRNFLDFFISYGLELGKQPQDQAFEELSQKLQAFSAASQAKHR